MASARSRARTFSATGEVITFEGFLKAYAESKDDEDDAGTADGESSFSRGLPPLSVGQDLPLQTLTATERFSARRPATPRLRW
ncbi:MAG: hypothetical protein WKG07_47605 [Hymenobacter sp.]